MLPEKPMITALTKAEMEIALPDNLTEEKIIKYMSSKDFWINLKIIFSNFFSGKERFYKIKTSEQNQEILLLAHHYYLRFYELIWYGWDDIFPQLNAIYDWKLKNPGDLLNIVLCAHSADWVNNERIAEPQTLYKAYKAFEIKDVKALQKWISRIEKQTGEKCTEIDKGTKIIELCVEIGKDSKSKIIKQHALDFKKAQLDQNNFLVKKLRKQF